MTIIKKFDTSEVQKNEFHYPKLSKKMAIPAIFGFVILIILVVWANNTVVTYGERLDKVNSLQQVLKMENQILENEIAKQSSLSNIASQSALLGFSKTEKLEYIR